MRADETGEPIQGTREQVGRERFDRFIELQGRLHAEQTSLTLSMGYAAHAGYSDEVLAAVVTDCEDLVRAAHNLAGHAARVADAWREQRDRLGRDE